MAFLALIRNYLKPTRRLIFHEEDPGATLATKIGGVPWWPQGIARPTCKFGHNLSFVAQILLEDVPDFLRNSGVLSVHYCQQCAYDGNMSFGWASDQGAEVPAGNYDVQIFQDCFQLPSDNLGIVAEDFMGPHAVTFSDRLETPNIQSVWDIAELNALLPGDNNEIEFMLQDAYGFDEGNFPDLVHIPVSKIGGWPSWAQNPEFPIDDDAEEVKFIGQLSPMGHDKETWCTGMLYLFLASVPGKPPVPKMVIQTT